MAKGTYERASISRTLALRAILDDFEPALSGKFHDGIHLTRPAGEMHHDDGFGPWSDVWRDELGRHVATLAVAIGKYRPRSGHRHASRGGNKRPAGHDDFIPLGDAERPQGQL